MEQHLTVREAKALTNKSESTIKRLIREIVAQPDHEDRGMILPSPDEVERRRGAGDTFVWKLNRDLLMRRFPRDVASDHGRASSRKPTAGATESVAILESRSCENNCRARTDGYKPSKHNSTGKMNRSKA